MTSPVTLGSTLNSQLWIGLVTQSAVTDPVCINATGTPTLFAVNVQEWETNGSGHQWYYINSNFSAANGTGTSPIVMPNASGIHDDAGGPPWDLIWMFIDSNATSLTGTSGGYAYHFTGGNGDVNALVSTGNFGASVTASPTSGLTYITLGVIVRAITSNPQPQIDQAGGGISTAISTPLIPRLRAINY
jgi:hypothetical protein